MEGGVERSGPSNRRRIESGGNRVVKSVKGAEELDPGDLKQLFEAGRSLVSAQHPETVLERLLEAARGLTGARYAAIGILDDQQA